MIKEIFFCCCYLLSCLDVLSHAVRSSSDESSVVIYRNAMLYYTGRRTKLKNISLYLTQYLVNKTYQLHKFGSPSNCMLIFMPDKLRFSQCSSPNMPFSRWTSWFEYSKDMNVVSQALVCLLVQKCSLYSSWKQIAGVVPIASLARVKQFSKLLPLN